MRASLPHSAEQKRGSSLTPVLPHAEGLASLEGPSQIGTHPEPFRSPAKRRGEYYIMNS